MASGKLFSHDSVKAILTLVDQIEPDATPDGRLIAAAVLMAGRSIQETIEAIAISEDGRSLTEHLHSLDMTMARIDEHLDPERAT